MKRDMELVRKILIELEKMDYTGGYHDITGVLTDYQKRDIHYHVMLLHEGGLIQALTTQDIGKGLTLWRPICLTWQGHEFLDLSRNDSVWSKALDKVKDTTGSVSLEVWKELLKQYVKDLILPGSG